MFDKPSTLIAFPLPATSSSEEPLMNQNNNSQILISPRRSDSIPLKMRSVVANVSALQQSRQRRSQSSHSNVPFHDPQGSEVDSLTDSKSNCSRHPMTSKLPTSVELKRIASVTEPQRRQRCVTESATTQRNHLPLSQLDANILHRQSDSSWPDPGLIHLDSSLPQLSVHLNPKRPQTEQMETSHVENLLPKIEDPPLRRRPSKMEIPSNEIGSSAQSHDMYHSKSCGELTRITSAQMHQLPPSRNDGQRSQDSHSTVSFDHPQGAQVNSSSGSRASRYPITYKIPTSTELKRMASIQDYGSRLQRLNISGLQKQTSAPQDSHLSSDPSKVPSLPLKSNPSSLITEMNQPTPSTNPSQLKYRQVTPITSEPQSNPGGSSTTVPIELGSHLTQKIETLRKETSHMPIELPKSTLLKKPSLTDRPRPVPRGHHQGFSSRAAALDSINLSLIKHHRDNDSAAPRSNIDRSARARSQSLDERSAFDQLMQIKLDYLTAIFGGHGPNSTQKHQPPVFDQSTRPRSQSLCDPDTQFDQPKFTTGARVQEFNLGLGNSPIMSHESLENLCSPAAFLHHGHHGYKFLTRLKPSNTRVDRFSAGSARSFFASLAKLDSDRASLNLELEIPVMKDSIERSSSFKSSHAASCAPKIRKKLKKLKKSSSTLKIHSRSFKQFDEALDRLEETFEKTNGTSTHCGVSRTTEVKPEKSVFETQSAFMGSRRFKQRFRRSCHKLIGIFGLRSHTLRRSQHPKKRSIFPASVCAPPHAAI